MKKKRLKKNELKWIEENPNEFVQLFLNQYHLIKNFGDILLHLRDTLSREEYSKVFKELLETEEKNLSTKMDKVKDEEG